jgi:hypothetical protein
VLLRDVPDSGVILDMDPGDYERLLRLTGEGR